MYKEQMTKDEFYTEVNVNIKREKKETIEYLEKRFALGCSEFSDGYNTALTHIIEYFKK